MSLVILFLMPGCKGQENIETPQPKATPITFLTPRLPAATPTSAADALLERPGNEMMMVYVPAGEFLMGSDSQTDLYAVGNELPQHKVYLDAYRMSRYEITNAQYAQCVNAAICDRPGSLVYYADPKFANHPVVFVSWSDAQTFCIWMGGRLPTEAEWEYAARGPQGFTYPWGDEFDCKHGNFSGEECDGYKGTAPVGSFEAAASWCGMQDMAGNVWEWVADWYSAYPSAAQENPSGPQTGNYKVLRGGLWHSDWEEGTRSANRFYYTPDFRDARFGFRCVVPFTPSP